MSAADLTPAAAARTALSFFKTYIEPSRWPDTRSFLQGLMAGRPDWQITRRPDPAPEAPPLAEWDPSAPLAARLRAVSSGLAAIRLDAALARLEAIAARDLPLAVVLASHDFAVAGAIERHAAGDARSADMAAGRILAALAVTEPQSGSDAALIETSLKRVDGRWRLAGRKNLVTGGADADLFLVFAKKPAESGEETLAAVLVDGRAAGIRRTPRDGWGLATAGLADIEFQDVELAPSSILSAPGDEVLAHACDLHRLAVAHCAIGAARSLRDAVVAWIKPREQFGRRLIEDGLVTERIADMGATIAAMEAMASLADRLAVNGADFAGEAAIARIVASEGAAGVAAAALRLHGGEGYVTPAFTALAAGIAGLAHCGGADDALRFFVALHGGRPTLQYIVDLRKARRRPLSFLDAACRGWLHGRRLALLAPRFPAFPAPLKDAVSVAREMARLLAERTHQLFCFYGNEAHAHGFDLARLAEIAIETEVMIALLVRCAASLAPGTTATAAERDEARLLALYHARRAWSRVARASRDLFLMDETVVATLAKSVTGVEPDKAE